jgi:hypothetical protein
MFPAELPKQAPALDINTAFGDPSIGTEPEIVDELIVRNDPAT